MKVKAVKAREILDSRGIPTIETYVTLEDGTTAKGAVPSGSSTGSREAFELRDNDPTRHLGKGVLTAVTNVNTSITKTITSRTFREQSELDNTLIELDGTDNKSSLGGNAILSVSMAFCKATAMSRQIPLYRYFMELSGTTELTNPQLAVLIMEGGKHGNWATDFQEYMVIPKREKFPQIKESLRVGAEIFHATHDILVDKGYSATVGLEGAFAPQEIESNTEAFEIILSGIEKAGYAPEDEILLGIDAAASEFFEDGTYQLKREQKVLSPDEWIDLQCKWYSDYPIWLIEDSLDEEDWDSWVKLTAKIGSTKQIVGDDLLTTNTKQIQKAIDLKAVNSVLIKINQIGTITETLQAIELSHNAKFKTIISHRGGETNDDLIADLVMGTDSWQTKFGGPDRGERLAKYNRLLEIEEGINL